MMVGFAIVLATGHLFFTGFTVVSRIKAPEATTLFQKELSSGLRRQFYCIFPEGVVQYMLRKTYDETYEGSAGDGRPAF
jgi:hypothetical protein